MVIVGRHINGITINPLEYVLDKDGDIMEFDTEEEAVAFLKDNGVTEKEIEYFVFKVMEECDRCGEMVDINTLGWYGPVCICEDCYQAIRSESERL